MSSEMKVLATVVCPGAVFAALVSDQFGITDIQEGLLLGSSALHTCTQISDTDMNMETTRNYIHISSYHSFALLGALHDGCGRVRQDVVAAVTQEAAEQQLQVIGWYIFRRCREPWDTVLLRERVVHLQLRDVLRQPQLLFLVCNRTRDEYEGLQTSNCLLHYYDDNVFHRLPLNISNLGNTSDSQYKLDPINPSLYTSPVTGSLASSLRGSEPGVTAITQLHAQLKDRSQHELQQHSSAEEERQQLLQELLVLRSQCYHLGIVPESEFPSVIGEEKSIEYVEDIHAKNSNNDSDELMDVNSCTNATADLANKADIATHSAQTFIRRKKIKKSSCKTVKSLVNSTEGLPTCEASSTSLQQRAELESKLNELTVRSASSDKRDNHLSSVIPQICSKRSHSTNQGQSSSPCIVNSKVSDDIITKELSNNSGQPQSTSNNKTPPLAFKQKNKAMKLVKKSQPLDGAIIKKVRPQSANPGPKKTNVKVKKRVNSASPRPDIQT